MAVEPIVIPLTVEAQNAAQQIQAFVDQAKRSIESITSSLNTVNQAFQNFLTLLDTERAKLKELEELKAQSGKNEQARIELEIQNIRKKIAATEDELSQLNVKRQRLQQIYEIQVVNGDRENQQSAQYTQNIITQNNQLNQTYIQLTQIASATSEVNIQMERAAGNATGFAGLASVMTAVYISLSAIERSFQRDVEYIEKIYNSAGQFKDLNKDVFDKLKPLIDAQGPSFGNNPDNISAIGELIFGHKGLSKATNLPSENIIGAATSLSPYLKKAGVQIGSEQWSRIVSQAALANYKGMDNNLIANYIGENIDLNSPNAEGEINKQLTGMTEIAGSPKLANEMFQGFQSEQVKAGAANFSLQDQEKIWGQLANKGIAPEQRGAASAGYLGALDKMMGKSPQDLVSEYEKMNDWSPYQKKELEIYKKHMNSQQLLSKMVSMKHGSATELDQYIINQANGGTSDIHDLASIVDRLPESDRERFFSSEGGKKANPSILAVSGWTNQNIVEGTNRMEFPSSDPEIALSNKDRSDYDAAKLAGSNVQGNDFIQRTKDRQKYLDLHPSLYGGMQKDSSEIGGFLGNTLSDIGSGTKEQQAQVSLLVDRMFAISQYLQDMDDGKIPNNPQLRALRINQFKEIRNLLKGQNKVKGALGTGDDESDIAMDALLNGSSNLVNKTRDPNANVKVTRNQVLQQYKSEDDRIRFGRDYLQIRGTHPFLNIDNLNDLNSNLPNYPSLDTDTIGTTPTPSIKNPTTQPLGPQSVNYNNNSYHVHYGYSQDSLGSVSTPYNNMG